MVANYHTQNVAANPAQARIAIRQAISALVDSRDAGIISDDIFVGLVKKLLACKIEMEMLQTINHKLHKIFNKKFEKKFYAMGGVL